MAPSAVAGSELDRPGVDRPGRATELAGGYLVAPGGLEDRPDASLPRYGVEDTEG